ncbi:MAG TPA: DUF4279 domain-containing protein [Solirubrobacteraceae bacterium]|nr:DUF4279 domain-containing protein [Solirubrobacteraceae bacterium]
MDHLSKPELADVWVSFNLVAMERDGQTFDPSYVTAFLGIEPTQQNRIGDSIAHGKGRRTYDRWRVSVGPVKTLDIEPMLDEVVSRFSACGNRLVQLCEEIGVQPILICTVEPKSEETPAIVFPVRIVRWAADNKVELAVDI